MGCHCFQCTHAACRPATRFTGGCAPLRKRGAIVGIRRNMHTLGKGVEGADSKAAGRPCTLDPDCEGGGVARPTPKIWDHVHHHVPSHREHSLQGALASCWVHIGWDAPTIVSNRHPPAGGGASPTCLSATQRCAAAAGLWVSIAGSCASRQSCARDEGLLFKLLCRQGCSGIVLSPCLLRFSKAICLQQPKEQAAACGV